MLQDALDGMAKQKARLTADMEYLQRQLDLVSQQAETAAADGKDSSEVGPSHLVTQDAGTSATHALTVVIFSKV